MAEVAIPEGRRSSESSVSHSSLSLLADIVRNSPVSLWTDDCDPTRREVSYNA